MPAQQRIYYMKNLCANWRVTNKSWDVCYRVLLRENCLHEEGMSLQYYSWSLTGILILKFGVLFSPKGTEALNSQLLQLCI